MKRFILFVFAFTFIFHAFALNPSRTYKQRPEKYNMKYTEFKAKTSDGEATINAWHFPAKSKTTNLMIICHNGEGNMGDHLRRVDQFTSIGYNVVIFDYRGYGESSEFEIDNNMYIYPHFQDDLLSVMDHVKKNFVATFSVYGWGIGGGLALGVGYSSPGVKKVIADTPFFSMEDLETRFEDMDNPMEVPFAGYEKRFEPGYALDGPPASKHLKGVLLIVGSNDPVYSKEDMLTLYNKQKKIVSKNIFVADNPDQKDNFKADKSEYFKAIREFLTN